MDVKTDVQQDTPKMWIWWFQPWRFSAGNGSVKFKIHFRLLEQHIFHAEPSEPCDLATPSNLLICSGDLDPCLRWQGADAGTGAELRTSRTSRCRRKMGADMEIEFCRKSAKNQGGSCRPSKAVLGKGIIKVHNIKVTQCQNIVPDMGMSRIPKCQTCLQKTT